MKLSFLKWGVGILAAFILVLVINPFTIVGAGERGVVLTWGAFNGTVLEPGLHFVMPIAQRVVKVDVRTQKLEAIGSEAYSHDLQNVKVHSVVNYNIDPKAAGLVYQQYGLGFENKILMPNLEASVKQTIAKYKADELLSKRGEVQSEIEVAYRLALPTEFIVTKYALVNESFSDAYEQAIEAKQVAQQQAEKASNELRKAEIDAKARVAQAQGEAEAIKIQAQAITQQGGQAYVDLMAIQKWDGKLPVQMIPGGTVPFIDLNK
ncbi:MAG: prohibitin family protein [bacterium]|nr:prohibitin family protein [bacterium]